MRHPIRLRGISGEVKGKVWESESVLRAGRLGTLEIVLDDSSVSRRHAEVRQQEGGWFARDLDSTNGTYVNGVRLGQEERQLFARDIVQFGKVALMVELLEVSSSTPPSSGTSIDQHLIEATTQSSWDDGLERLAYKSNHEPRAAEQLMALLKAGRHLASVRDEAQLLDKILKEAVRVLDAQRGAIVLAEGRDGRLALKALATGHGDSGSGYYYSKKLANRCMKRGESILCRSVEDDEELAMQHSIADGAMASVLCVLLRTPRNRLGVLHLDRSFWQSPFTEEDLHVADALAAHVSAGIEAAQLLRQQKELFLSTIKILAQAVELRDEYTGGHTERVTGYAVALARKLALSEDDLDRVRIGTPLHDIGKIGIDDTILRKPGKLTPEEFAVMRTHTVKGEAIIRIVPDLHPIAPIVRSHHERWDGKGYPDGLAGADIPQIARIVAVADAFDAMTSSRPYHEGRKGKSPEAAFAEVEAMAGKQFDPEAAAAFLGIKDQVMDMMTCNQKTWLVPG